MDAFPSPNAALVEAARALAARKLGRARLPCQVVVRLTDTLEVEAVAVEVVGAATDGDGLPVGDCFRDVVVLLARTGHRLTTTEILAGLAEQDTPHGDGPVRATLAAAVKDKLLTNNPKGKPHPGYGLPGWD
jgi:hypothetical protein